MHLYEKFWKRNFLAATIEDARTIICNPSLHILRHVIMLKAFPRELLVFTIFLLVHPYIVINSVMIFALVYLRVGRLSM